MKEKGANTIFFKVLIFFHCLNFSLLIFNIFQTIKSIFFHKTKHQPNAKIFFKIEVTT